MTEYGIERDSYGRPKLYPPEGGGKVSYTRASTAAKIIDDKGGLINWSASQAMIGLMQSKPLQARVSAIVARTREDVYRENKTALRELVNTATTIAQAQGRADWGVAFHELSELLDKGELDWVHVPEKLKGPLDAYEALGLKVLDTEIFVAVDQMHGQSGNKTLRIAGSMDCVLEHPDYGPIAADKKTGTDEVRYGNGCQSQVAIYSRGRRYRDGDFPGAPIFTDGEPNPNNTAWRKPLWPGLNDKVGALIHVPLEKVDGKYEASVYALDLEAGWKNVMLGQALQAARRHPKLKKIS